MIGKLFDKGLINYHQLIFEYQSKLELTSDEVVVLMQLLNLAQRKRYSLSTLTLARMTSLKTNVVGEIVNSLFEKDIISIQFERKTSNEKLKEVFDLKPLFAKILDFLEEDIERDKEIKSITDIEY